MSTGESDRMRRWREAFFSEVLRRTTLDSPVLSEPLRRAESGLVLSQEILHRVVGAPGEPLDRELNHHGALFSMAWEGFRHGILAMLLAVHGNYTAADATTRAALETGLSGACLDRLVHEVARGRTGPFRAPFDDIAETLRRSTSKGGPSLADVDAASGYAIPLVGRRWGDKVRFDDLMRQVDDFALLAPLRRTGFRKYVRYDILSSVAHAAPTRTELHRRVLAGAGGPFDFQPEFLPQTAESVLDSVHRCVDASLLVSLNALADCIFVRSAFAPVLRDLADGLKQEAGILPRAEEGIRRLLDRLESPSDRRRNS